MTLSTAQTALAVVAAVVLCGDGVRSQINGSPSPPSEFLTPPSNTTVPEGEQAVLKCLVGSAAHVCRWYFLELGLDFFDPRVTPMLVKDFTPAHRRDCSIRIKKVRKVQEGQWLCQALKFHSSEFLMTPPAVLRVIKESEKGSWTPPPPPPSPTPRQGRRNHESGNPEDDMIPGNTMEFESSQEDYIQNAKLGDSVILKCQVNMPISACSWVMPHGAYFNLSQDKVDSKNPSVYADDYRLEGDLSEGNCTLQVREVRPQDEGDWRCEVEAVHQHSQGPLLHLHIIQNNHPSTHTHEGTPLVAPKSGSMDILVNVLVVTCSVLFLTVVMLFTCLYRRVNRGSEETRKILPLSPRGSLDMTCKTLPSTDLMAASVLAVEVMKKGLPCLPLDRYNQYLDMSGTSSSADGYIMMPGSSLRSSTSSRTTLSTLSTLPCGRSRSASSSTTLSTEFPHLITIVDNPSYINSPKLSHTESLYKGDHIYEEIKEKEISEKMEKIPEIRTPVTPTYTNISKDVEGYMVPKKVPSSDALPEEQSQDSPELPVPNPTHLNLMDVSPRKAAMPSPCQAVPYSRIGECGLVPASPTQQSADSPGPGYSRVGSVSPEERYDTPRPLPSNPIDRYDVPRAIPTELSFQSQNIPVSPDVSVDTLPGTIV